MEKLSVTLHSFFALYCTIDRLFLWTYHLKTNLMDNGQALSMTLGNYVDKNTLSVSMVKLQ